MCFAKQVRTCEKIHDCFLLQKTMKRNEVNCDFHLLKLYPNHVVLPPTSMKVHFIFLSLSRTHLTKQRQTAQTSESRVNMWNKILIRELFTQESSPQASQWHHDEWLCVCWMCLSVCVCGKFQGTEVVTPRKKTVLPLPLSCLWIIKPCFEEWPRYYLFTCLSHMIHEKRENKREAWGDFCQARHIQGHAPS